MSNKTKQTAVEWLGMEMGKLFAQYHGKIICIGEFHQKRFELLDQAKEMEKERMLECYLKADVFPRKYEFEQWYDETYGGNK
jgi:hypothetical protein